MKYDDITFEDCGTVRVLAAEKVTELGEYKIRHRAEVTLDNPTQEQAAGAEARVLDMVSNLAGWPDKARERSLFYLGASYFVSRLSTQSGTIKNVVHMIDALGDWDESGALDAGLKSAWATLEAEGR